MLQLDSVLSTFKARAKNPFFGTLAFVWFIRNWDLIFMMFNFDSTMKLDERMDRLCRYFDSRNFWQEAGINVAFAIGAMIVGYILLLVTRWLSTFFEYRLTPYVVRTADSNLVIEKRRFDDKVKQLFQKTDELEKEREENDELKDKNAELKKANLKLEYDLKEMSEVHVDANKQHLKSQAEYKEKEAANHKVELRKESIVNLVKYEMTNPNQVNPLALSAFIQLISDGKLSIGRNILNQGILRSHFELNESESSYFEGLGLVQPYRHRDEEDGYTLTSIGHYLQLNFPHYLKNANIEDNNFD
ncbi:hypothetical protein [Flavobacterium silvaticum]|uniref:Uncharacterized protein n=1 Tax=Flavobacterium silvaticum TaxID=1852020 RepID=A0A972JHL4_9FLAO|nr:hypothetical protein [Flavobacterium silvaticum]NMH28065.1 hypothetical protein [Flavobacterium silvaticum]